jgi:hypothetical protein
MSRFRKVGSITSTSAPRTCSAKTLGGFGIAHDDQLLPVLRFLPAIGSEFLSGRRRLARFLGWLIRSGRLGRGPGADDVPAQRLHQVDDNVAAGPLRGDRPFGALPVDKSTSGAS